MAFQDIPTEPLRAWVRDLFTALGSRDEEARLVADHLVESNLAGHDSHGVSMIPTYLDAIDDGFLQLNRDVLTVLDSGAMLILDGQRGLGQSVAHQAMSLGIDKAREHGIALMGLRNAHHIGRIGHWAEQAMAAGLVAVHFTNAMYRTPIVAPHGGREARFLTNPFTVGIPRRDGMPILLDFATSAIAHGKARVALNAGKSVPPGTVIDSEGRPTTDPRAVFDEPLGALRTFAEHKGHALAMVCELLGAAMIGGVAGHPEHFQKGPGVINNMLTLLFDPERLGTQASFEREASAFIDWVQSAKSDEIGEALGGVLMPGDTERLSRAARAERMPLDDGTLSGLAEAAVRASARGGAAVEDPRSLVG